MSIPKPATIVITGAPRTDPIAPGQPPPPRLEIHDLVKDRRQFSLYAQAVGELQKLKQKDFLSWYAIAGIHGKPDDVAWDGAPPKDPNWVGYCTHGIVLFPTWHRPYVALFEQALQAQAVKIANKYQVERAAWKQAAENLRAPYWDWGYTPTSIPPKEMYDYGTVDIIGFGGKPTTIPNPFLSFAFDPPLHYPGSNDDHRITYRIPGLVKRLQDIQQEVPTKVYHMLILARDWYSFSNHSMRPGDSSPVSNSLEAVHDLIHVTVGGLPDKSDKAKEAGDSDRKISQACDPDRSKQPGDMSDPLVAAFDPLFWLHHSNVDRLLSFWQTIHPGVWVNDPYGYYDANTDLIPFWKSTSPASFHQSSSPPVRTWTDFNYTYPEFVSIHDSSPKDRRQAILKIVKRLYDSGGTHGGPDAKDYDEWYVRVRSKKYALGGTYIIYIFLGTPPELSSEWTMENNLVGRHAVFANSNPERCSNCSEHIDDLHEGFVVLTTTVEEKLGVGKSLQEIKEYLANNLTYRVKKADGDIVPTSEVPGFRASIETIKLSYSQDDEAYQRPDGVEPFIHSIFEGGASASGSA